ncbi:MAG: tRNA (guanosine(37)-N1)-methyltransferase TrmD [Nitrospirota bacterium]|nr:tRNA (guanosine(37)-N1)-methyltransferase TrmD [Nitrospirota bacterium]
MKFSVLSIFPEMLAPYLEASILKRAIEKGILEVGIHNPRDYATGRHKVVDDSPYGGGSGMVMKPEPFFRILRTLWPEEDKRKIIMLSPKGRIFNQDIAMELSKEKRDVVLLCGRYEAIDERVGEYLVDDEISIGDYVLTGGELAALVIIDAVTRLIPGVLGDSRSAEEESFSWGLLDYPHYTRPEEYRGMKVPGVLLSGNHAEINRWRKKQALKLTLERRPDLLKKYLMTEDDKKMLDEIKEE